MLRRDIIKIYGEQRAKEPDWLSGLGKAFLHGDYKAFQTEGSMCKHCGVGGRMVCLRN